MTLKFDEIIAPSHWASYLINADESGTDPDQIAAADRHFDGWHVVSVADESWFSACADLYGSTSRGDELTTYTVQKI